MPQPVYSASPDKMDSPEQRSPRLLGWLSRIPRSPDVVVLGIIALTIVAQLPWMVLHNDVRFTFGSVRAATAGGIPSTDVFVHRPMMNRQMVSSLGFLLGAGPVRGERLVITTALVALGLAAVALQRSLKTRIDSRAAATAALAVFLSLAWSPSSYLLQPEWIAALLSVAGIALALCRVADGPHYRRAIHIWCGLSGAALALAALQKYVTVVAAIVAIVVILALDRRRAIMVAGYTVLISVVLFAVTLGIGDHEWQWFAEMPRLNRTAGIQWQLFRASVLNISWATPALALTPAAAVYMLGLPRAGRWAAGLVAVWIVSLGAVVVQNAFFMYQYTEFLVVTNTFVALTAYRWWSRRRSLPIGIVLPLSLWLPVAVASRHGSLAERSEHVTLTAVGLVATALFALAVTLRQVRFGPNELRKEPNLPVGRAAAILMMLVVAAAITFPGWPKTPNGYNYLWVTKAAAIERRDGLAAQGAAVRAKTGGRSVVYFAGADTVYFTALPTKCSYPVPTFLYRTQVADTEQLHSFTENIECFADPRNELLAYQPGLASMIKRDKTVLHTIRAGFDCKHPLARTPDTLFCPRKHRPGS